MPNRESVTVEGCLVCGTCMNSRTPFVEIPMGGVWEPICSIPCFDRYCESGAPWRLGDSCLIELDAPRLQIGIKTEEGALPRR
jgi:hypothetical protein